jgi:hypothetical protein
LREVQVFASRYLLEVVGAKNIDTHLGSIDLFGSEVTLSSDYYCYVRYAYITLNL